MNFKINVMNTQGIFIQNMENPSEIRCIKPVNILGKFRLYTELKDNGDGTYQVTRYVADPDCPGGACPVGGRE